MLLYAYRNLISIQRSSLRTINAYEAREKKKNKSYYLTHIIEYKNIVFDELKANCKRIINFIDDYLIKRAKQDEAIVFYYKMKGDFNRYIAEFAVGNLKKHFEDSGLKAYNEAIKRSSKLQILNPVRLRLFLNYSFFQYDILNNKKKAIEIVKNAINEANKELPDIDEDDGNEEINSIYNDLKETVDL